MTYAAAEGGVYSGAPVELYRFTAGLAVFAYTSGETDETYSAELYRSTQIERGALELSDEQARQQLDIELPRDNAVPLLFVSGPPTSLVGLTVFRFHRGDGDVKVIWKGRVGSCEWSGSRARLICESVYSSLSRSMLRSRYQRLCRHALYDELCTLNREAFADAATVSAVAGEVVSIAATARPDGYFAGGYLQRANGQRRMIRAQTGGTLTLLSAAFGLQPGEAVQLYAGCDHTQATCAAKFSNVANFGGFPNTPTKNPFGSGGIL